MPPYNFDTLAAVKRMTAAGLPVAQAEAIANVNRMAHEQDTLTSYRQLQATGFCGKQAEALVRAIYLARSFDDVTPSATAFRADP